MRQHARCSDVGQGKYLKTGATNRYASSVRYRICRVRDLLEYLSTWFQFDVVPFSRQLIYKTKAPRIQVTSLLMPRGSECAVRYISIASSIL